MAYAPPKAAEIALWTALIGKPKTAMVQFLEYRGKLALALGHCGWLLVVPVRGRKPTTPCKIPLRPLWDVCERAEGKISVHVDPVKQLGVVEGVESSGWKITHPFPCGQYNFSVSTIPEESTEPQTCPTSLLEPLAKCSRIAVENRCVAITAVRITPGGEFGATDGKRLLLEVA